MKRFLSFALCGCMLMAALLCFAGCGETEEKQPHETDSHSEGTVSVTDTEKPDTEATESEGTETEKVDEQNIEIFWKHKDVKPPKVPELKTVVQSEEDGCKSIVVDTTMDWRIEELRKYVDEIGFAKDWNICFDSGQESVGFHIYTDISNQVTFDTIDGYSKFGSDDQSISVTIYTDTSKFAGVHQITIRGAVKTDASDYQNALYELARKCFGDEYAEFVVYGTEKGDNGKYEVESNTEKFWYQNSQKYASFNFLRELTFENGLCSFDFSLYLIDNKCTGSNYPSSGGYEPHFLDKANDVLQTILPALGTYDPYALTEYGRNVFSQIYDYSDAYLDQKKANTWSSEITSDSNKISFHHVFKFNVNGINHNDATMHPTLEFDCLRSEYENSNRVVDRLSFIGTTERVSSSDYKSSKTELFEKAKKEFSVLFPEIKVDNAEFGKDLKDETTGNIVEINGIKYKYGVKFETVENGWGGAGRWTLSLTTFND